LERRGEKADWEQVMATSALVETSPDFFETIYAEARGERGLVPWDRGRPNTALVNWLNAAAPTLVRCGARVAVVGCGLGHDANELVRRGYEVTAFDCSPTATRWAKRLYPACAACFHDADLFELPPRWRHRFDLVVEISTLQALLPEQRPAAVAALTQLMSPRGRLLVICRASRTPVSLEEGPPWPLAERELLDVTTGAGLLSEGPISCFQDAEEPAELRIRAVFTRV
jgi:SAM-dependent methyltransferase